MEVVWHAQFERLFNTFPHQWRLKPVSAANTEHFSTNEYAVFQDSAKVRFLCKVTYPIAIVLLDFLESYTNTTYTLVSI